MRAPRPDIGRTGWMRTMPIIASRVYMNLWMLHSQTGFPLFGDLDDPLASWWVDLVAFTGLDAPYDPDRDPVAEECDQEEKRAEAQRWEEWQGYAKERDLPMTTCRHVIEFMLELGLIERRESALGTLWMIVSPLPDVESVLNLSPERREEEAITRWRIRFNGVGETIADWMAGLSTPNAETDEFTTSINAVAEQLSMDPEDARHGLAVLLDDDVSCDVDPETAAADAPLRIRVNWPLFEELRAMYRLAPEAEDELDA
jgi:hypothetical protein